MKPIYVLWATPRSTSTAFEWMMRMRGDIDDLPQRLQCLYQDFLPHYQHLHAHRLSPDSARPFYCHPR